MNDLLEMKLRKKNINVDNISQANTDTSYNKLVDLAMCIIDKYESDFFINPVDLKDEMFPNNPHELYILMNILDKSDIKRKDNNDKDQIPYTVGKICNYFLNKLYSSGYNEFCFDFDFPLEINNPTKDSPQLKAKFNNIDGLRRDKSNLILEYDKISQILLHSIHYCTITFNENIPIIPRGSTSTFNIKKGIGSFIQYNKANCPYGCTYNFFDEKTFIKAVNVMGDYCPTRKHAVKNTLNLIDGSKLRETKELYWKY